MKGSKPIFQDPPPNVDETWTQGGMFGGMCGYDQQALAESYFRAADTLIAAIEAQDDGLEGRDVINPVLDAYRHGIELYLTIIVQPESRSHDLEALLVAFLGHVQIRHGQAVPSWFSDRIREFVRYDPDGDVFRYEHAKSRTLQSEGEFWVDLPSVKATMGRLHEVFGRLMVTDGQRPEAWMSSDPSVGYLE